jgi:hypothetical protein
MVVRHLPILVIACAALPGLAQVMPQLPGDHEFTNCRNDEPMSTSRFPSIAISARICSANLNNPFNVVEGKYVLMQYRREEFTSSLGPESSTNYYGAFGISCSDGLFYYKNIAESRSGKGIKYVSSDWEKHDLEYPGDPGSLINNARIIVKTRCPLRPGYSRVGSIILDLRNVVRNSDRANVRGYEFDKDYLLSLDCRRLTFGIDEEPKTLIPPGSSALEAYKKICLASRK